MARIGLGLGAGLVGPAYQAGVLAALQADLGPAVHSADVIVAMPGSGSTIELLYEAGLDSDAITEAATTLLDHERAAHE